MTAVCRPQEAQELLYLPDTATLARGHHRPVCPHRFMGDWYQNHLWGRRSKITLWCKSQSTDHRYLSSFIKWGKAFSNSGSGGNANSLASLWLVTTKTEQTNCFVQRASMDIKSSLRDSRYPSSQTLFPGLGFALLTIISQGLLEHILFIRAQYGAEDWDPGSSRETHAVSGLRRHS